MRRPLAVSLLALALLAACSDDEEGAPDTSAADAALASQPTVPVAVSITPLAVNLQDPGAAPREVLEQDLAEGSASAAAVTFTLAVEGVTTGTISGESRLEVTEVDDEGLASVDYALEGLDVAISAGSGESADPVRDALDLTGELTVGADRGVTSATIETEGSGAIPGIESVATSLDPRLTSLLLPFPIEPIGIGAVWTVQGPIAVFGATVSLTAEIELVERQEDRYVLTAAIAMETPTPGGGPDVALEGIGRLTGDVRQLALTRGSIVLDGTVVLPDRGQSQLPMSVEIAVGRA